MVSSGCRPAKLLRLAPRSPYRARFPTVPGTRILRVTAAELLENVGVDMPVVEGLVSLLCRGGGVDEDAPRAYVVRLRRQVFAPEDVVRRVSVELAEPQLRLAPRCPVIRLGVAAERLCVIPQPVNPTIPDNRRMAQVLLPRRVGPQEWIRLLGRDGTKPDPTGDVRSAPFHHVRKRLVRVALDGLARGRGPSRNAVVDVPPVVEEQRVRPQSEGWVLVLDRRSCHCGVS